MSCQRVLLINVSGSLPGVTNRYRAVDSFPVTYVHRAVSVTAGKISFLCNSLSKLRPLLSRRGNTMVSENLEHLKIGLRYVTTWNADWTTNWTVADKSRDAFMQYACNSVPTCVTMPNAVVLCWFQCIDGCNVLITRGTPKLGSATWGLASSKGDVHDPLQTRQAARAYTCRAGKAGPLTSCLPGSLGVIRTDTDRSGIRYLWLPINVP